MNKGCNLMPARNDLKKQPNFTGYDMSKKQGWGVKWEIVYLGSTLFFGVGLPAAIFYLGFNTIYISLVAVSFTGLLALIWGLMGEGAKY